VVEEPPAQVKERCRLPGQEEKSCAFLASEAAAAERSSHEQKRRPLTFVKGRLFFSPFPENFSPHCIKGENEDQFANLPEVV
jgi:hypothetical protein